MHSVAHQAAWWGTTASDVARWFSTLAIADYTTQFPEVTRTDAPGGAKFARVDAWGPGSSPPIGSGSISGGPPGGPQTLMLVAVAGSHVELTLSPAPVRILLRYAVYNTGGSMTLYDSADNLLSTEVYGPDGGTFGPWTEGTLQADPGGPYAGTPIAKLRWSGSGLCIDRMTFEAG